VFALALGLVALLISFGRNFPLYGFLYDHLPLFNKFRVPVMIILLFQLATALGCAWGWSAWTRREGSTPANRGLDRVEIGAAIVLVIALIGAAFAAGGGEAGYAAFATARRAADGEAFPPQLASLAYHQFISDLMRGCFLGLIALAIAWAARRGKLPAMLATAGILVVMLIELWPVSGRVMAPALGDPEQRNAELGRDDVIDFLRQQGDAGSFRILPAQEFQSNRYAGFAIASVGGYHAAKPRLVQDLIRKGVAQSTAWLRTAQRALPRAVAGGIAAARLRARAPGRGCRVRIPAGAAARDRRRTLRGRSARHGDHRFGGRLEP
jgi:hypothetical protein